MIRFDAVTKTFDGRDALRGLTFEINSGEMVFITGHSGAGKSTLLRLAGLLDQPTSGAVVVLGQNLARLPRNRRPIFRRRLGMVFQDHRLLLRETVYDNIALPLRIARASENEIRKRVRAALASVDLAGQESAQPARLSSGEQQRVGIARAIVHRPVILLADEPTGNLDPQLSREVFALFKRFNQFGITVVVATHDLGQTAGMNARIVRLQAGQAVVD